MRQSRARVFGSSIVFSMGFFVLCLLFPLSSHSQTLVAADDSVTAHGGTVFALLANDTLNGTNPYVTIVSTPSHGSVTAVSGGAFYSPAYGYAGGDSFTYKICLATCSNVATVTVTVDNDAPVTLSDFFFVWSGTSRCIDILANDSDPENDTFSREILTYPSSAMGHLSGGPPWCDLSFVSYTPGYASFTYRACDSYGICSGSTNVSLYSFAVTDELNAGSSCAAPLPPQSPIRPSPDEGAPVNVTTGNMWLTQNDYRLPGIGESIEVDRFYNSRLQNAGLFGTGWYTKYDQSIKTFGTAFSDKAIQLNAPDGRGILYVRSSTSDPFVNLNSEGRAEIVLNTDGTYTQTYKDGRSNKFGSNGKLLWQKDRNGNQTTVNYDTSGVLTGVTDAVGRTLTFTLNGSGNVTEIADSTGSVATYEYFTSSSRLKTVTYPDGSKYKFEYTTVGSTYYLATVKDALDNILETHAYDSSGRATTSEVDGGVNKYTFDYTNIGSGQAKATDTLGRETKYTFDKTRGVNLITSMEGVCGCGSGGSETTTYTYDRWSNLVKKVDALSNQTTYNYDSSSNLTSVTDVLGTQSFTYNSLGQVLTHTDRMSGVTTNTYDTAGNLLTTTDPLSNTTEFTYTSLDQLETIEDARSNVTEFDYDSSGRMIKITDANAKETDFTYNARAKVTSLTNALSQTTEFEYDAKDRLEKIIYPDTNEVNFDYDLAGRRTSVTDELGHATTYAYDDAYRVTSITDALSHTTSFGYDLMSNLTSQTDALSNVTSFEYDDFNRLKKIVYPAPSPSATPLQETMTYDKNGNVKTKVDTGGRTTSYDYDTANRLTKITDALTNQTQFTYNARSQTTKVKDALNQEYTFTYDALGRVLTQTRNGTTMTFTYDNVGNRITREDYNGDDTTYTYDDLNRLTNISYTGASGENASYTYDDLSRLLTAVNAAGTVTFTYDNRGRLATEEDIFGHDLEYTYDAVGRRTALELDTAAHTSYTYDNANRLTTLSAGIAQDFTFSYDNANRLTSRSMPNAVTSTYEYDSMSRLKRLKHSTALTTLYDDQFTYNTANQISQIAGLSLTKNYTYDNINRLTGMTDGTNTESYTYDAVGNRTASHLSASYTTGSFNRLTATTAASYSYNSNGSTTGKTVGSVNWTYGLDRENRLVSAGDGTNTASYAYDALGRRVKRTEGSDVQKYTHDGQDIVLDDINTTLTKYQNGPGIDNKLSSTTGLLSDYFLADHLSSTKSLTNALGLVTSSNDYDSFGNPTNSSFSTRYGYTGREIDPTSGLNFYRARFYDSKLGRFISEDPVGFGGGDVNLFGYVRNQSIGFNDPTGLIGVYAYPDGRYRNPYNLWEYRDFYNDLHRRRVGGHQRYPGEGNSAMRHCVVSCESSSIWGSSGVRLMGFGNEGQGLVLDAWRWSNSRPMGAFQWSDIQSNERGFGCAQTVRNGLAGTCVECCAGGCSGTGKNSPGDSIWPIYYSNF